MIEGLLCKRKGNRLLRRIRNVLILDISTKKFPNARMKIDEYDWRTIRRRVGKVHAVSPNSKYSLYAHARWYSKGRDVAIHQLILPNAKEIDHINGNGLDNTRKNLREVTHAQNQWNRNQQRDFKRSSQYKGVRWFQPCHKWGAYITQNGIRFFLGYYTNEERAARAYNKAATTLYGSYARLNRL
jgi:hypothetical protein